MSSKFCLTPHCSNEAKTRGLCRNCYAAANRLVQDEERPDVTWRKLVELRLALPSARGDGQQAFLEALEARLRGEYLQPAQPEQSDPPADPRAPKLDW